MSKDYGGYYREVISAFYLNIVKKYSVKHELHEDGYGVHITHFDENNRMIAAFGAFGDVVNPSNIPNPKWSVARWLYEKHTNS